MNPGELPDVDVRSLTILLIPPSEWHKGKNVVVIIPGFVVLTLQAYRTVIFFKIINTTATKNAVFSGDISSPPAFGTLFYRL